MSVKVKDCFTPEGRNFLKAISELTEKEVRVGFQRGKATEEDGTDICDIAAWNELGTEDIPSRPFIRDSVDNNEAEIEAFLQRMQRRIINGQSAEKTLKQIGVFQKGLIQREITKGNFAKNSEVTIKRKGSDTPLIDTGRLRQSVNFVIEKKGSGE